MAFCREGMLRGRLRVPTTRSCCSSSFSNAKAPMPSCLPAIYKREKVERRRRIGFARGVVGTREKKTEQR